jgi:hypothetical protein
MGHFRSPALSSPASLESYPVGLQNLVPVPPSCGVDAVLLEGTVRGEVGTLAGICGAFFGGACLWLHLVADALGERVASCPVCSEVALPRAAGRRRSLLQMLGCNRSRQMVAGRPRNRRLIRFPGCEASVDCRNSGRGQTSAFPGTEKSELQVLFVRVAQNDLRIIVVPERTFGLSFLPPSWH